MPQIGGILGNFPPKWTLFDNENCACITLLESSEYANSKNYKNQQPKLGGATDAADDGLVIWRI
ncbi:MAG: hypothetical protein DDT24_00756 [Chloroflexi bacterium]|nr:hypothetical protein [Chloroflexota bacterium]